MILSARLIKRPRSTRYCASCERPIGGRTLRLYGMADAGDTPSTLYFHPHVEEVDEIRACAPDVPAVRAALGLA